MRALILSIVLSACGQDLSTPISPAQAPPPGTLTLLASSSVAILDGPMVFTVTGAPPGATVALLGSASDTGSPWCPPLVAPTCTGLRKPARVLSNRTADSAGRATFLLQIPATLSAANLHLQAAATHAGSLADISAVLDRPLLSRTGDEDRDDLTNGDEVFSWGTDPRLADSDGGGLEDYVEAVVAQTDPTDPSDDPLVSWDCVGPPPGTQPGYCATDFRLPDAWGELHSLSDFRGYVTVLDISHMWCRPCQLLAADQDITLAPFAGQGVRWVTVLEEDYQGNDPDSVDLLAWIAAYDDQGTVLAGSGHSVTGTWLGGGKPTIVVLDRQGEVTWRIDSNPGPAAIQAAIQAAL